MDSYLYLVGGALLILAILLGRFRGGGNTMRARDVSGNVHVGNVSNGATKTSTSSGDKGNSEPDRIAWGIAIVGVLVALAQFAQDFVKQ
jgi:hypothetical protein